MEVVDADSGPTAVATGARTSLPWAQVPARPAPGGQVPEPPPPPPPTQVNRDVVVQPGDSMWSIARHELRGRLGRQPTNAEVDPYWRSLIEANRDQLVDPGNPDLIYPGQAFLLP
jgi:nucleoid-associated protein YgaU